jgi:hypothetical protein
LPSQQIGKSSLKIIDAGLLGLGWQGLKATPCGIEIFLSAGNGGIKRARLGGGGWSAEKDNCGALEMMRRDGDIYSH